MRIFTTASVLFALGLVSSIATATPNFPGEIKNHLSLSYQPSCATCHLNGVTGLGTVTTPFGISMRNRGLAANDTGSLDTALDALSAEMTDSDGDGTGDIAELMAQTDPNVAGGSAGSALTPKYGCGGGDLIYPARPSAIAGIAAALGLGGLVVLARRRAAFRNA